MLIALPSSFFTSSILLLLTLTNALSVTPILILTLTLTLTNALSPTPIHSHSHSHQCSLRHPHLHRDLTLSPVDTEVVISKAESKTLRNRILGLVWQHIAWLLCGLIGAAMVRTYVFRVRTEKTVYESLIRLLSAHIESRTTQSLLLVTAPASTSLYSSFSTSSVQCSIISLVYLSYPLL